MELRESVLELSAEELVECLAKDLCSGTCGTRKTGGTRGTPSNQK